MTAGVQTAAGHSQPSRRQEILDWYDRLPRRSVSQLFGVAPNADTQAAREAFRALVTRFHPDAPGQTRPGPEARAHAEHPPAAVESSPRRERVQEAIESAQAYLGRNEIDAAVDVLYEVAQLADGGQRGTIRMLLATAYAADPKRRRNALTLLSDILRDEPSHAEALTLLGTLYLREGLLARAESTLARAVALSPGHKQALAKLLSVRESLHERSAPETRRTRRSGFRARLPWMAR